MNETTLTPDILKTKQHYDILDGLRGVAALSVVTFHFMEIVYSDYSQNFIGNGFLAVDFFFCLSGFVIAFAYDDRIKKTGVIEFFKSRLIRLHPLVIIGSVLGLLAFLFDPFGGQPQAESAGRLVTLFFSSALMIPNPTMPGRIFNCFGLNAPSWSLFWEYVANIFYAFILWRIGKRFLIFVLIPTGLALCFVAYRSGNLMGGWDGHTFWDGGACIAYSFLAGMLVYRFNIVIKNKLGFIGVAILLIAAFLMPFSTWNWLTQPLVVIVYFPLLIALGVGATLAPQLKKICIFFGKISYPLYMTHYSVMWMFANYLTKYKPSPVTVFVIITTGLIILVCFAWLVMTVYDTPVRAYLNKKRKQSL